MRPIWARPHHFFLPLSAQRSRHDTSLVRFSNDTELFIAGNTACEPLILNQRTTNAAVTD